MPNRSFKQVDVFTSKPFCGNPVAVVLNGQGLDSLQMQRIANWTNLSETTFVLPPNDSKADYRVRIFTPTSELPFAGHPTIGTAHALLEAGLVVPNQEELIQECGAGLVKLRVQNEESGDRFISFDLPPATLTDLSDVQVTELQAVLGVDLAHEVRPKLIDVGARWIVAQLQDANSVLAARPDLARMSTQDVQAKVTGVVIFGMHDSDRSAKIEVRAFAPSCGVSEDPVCGSGNGCVAVFLRETAQTHRVGSSYIATQGQVVGREGQVLVGIEPNRITIGGAAVTCIEGVLADGL